MREMTASRAKYDLVRGTIFIYILLKRYGREEKSEHSRVYRGVALNLSVDIRSTRVSRKERVESR